MTHIHNTNYLRNAIHPYTKLFDNRRHPLPPRSWTIPVLAAAYGCPTGSLGGGTIAIVELGGGWNAADVAAAFSAMNLPEPVIVDVSVDGTANSPGADADAEVALDIQVAGGVYAYMTGHAALIRIYWSQDIGTAVAAAAADGCDVCSISWGADEAVWGQAAGEAMEITAAAATEAGMAVFAASGDNDSSDGGRTPANVDLPAGCPHVVGCGGTSWVPGSSDLSEVVWNNNPHHPDGSGTGGGFSSLFPVQAWQVGVPHGRGRMVPDVAAVADPNTGYDIILNGMSGVIGGTSAVAPFYAGMVAAYGMKPGWITPKMFQHSTDFHDITSGDNGHYKARVGPDACTGLGSPTAQLANVF
ncbi:MAG TPA: S8 family serine peptidase [Candidatus Angelobacter sp.]|nr:S8 family serine peptidase [Candidatus Angelobacter sp.]